MNTQITNPKLRHDFVFLFDVENGNPNGDPDAGNMPRVDPETMHGLVTDVCIKRKIRDYVAMNYGGEPGCGIYIQNSGVALNTINQQAYDELGIKSTGTKQNREDIDKAREYMCKNYYDIRMFGAVMTTGRNCGQVRGPVQLTFAKSIDPITPLDISITRVAITRPEDAEVAVADDSSEQGKGKTTEMGRKQLIPYGLYLGKGFFSPLFAEKTGVAEKDLEIFWEAMQNMLEIDRSASRGLMSMRGIYVFTHDNAAGRAHAHTLFDHVSVSLKPGVEAPRSFADYVVEVCDKNLPEGVTLTKLELG